MKLRTHSAGARFRDALPKRKEAWLKLASLPFKAYTVLAFWVVVIHELSVPGRIRDGSLRWEIVLGYLSGRSAPLAEGRSEEVAS